MNMLSDIANKIQQSKFHWTDVAIRIGIDINDVLKIEKKNDSPLEFVHSITQKIWDEIFHFVGLNLTGNDFTEISSIAKFIHEIAKRISQWRVFGRILNLEESFLNQLQTDCSSSSERNHKIIEKFSMPLQPDSSWMFWRQYLDLFEDGKLVIKEMEGTFVDLLSQIPDTVAHIVTSDRLTYVGHPFQYRRNKGDYTTLDKENKLIGVQVGSKEFQYVHYQNFSEWIVTQKHFMDTYNMFKDLKTINFVDENPCPILETLKRYLDEVNHSGFAMKGYNFVNHFCLFKQGVYTKDIFNDSYFCILAHDNVVLYLTKSNKGTCHAVHRSLHNVQIANVLHSDLQSNNITQINVIMHDETIDCTKFCKRCIDNDLFVNEETFTDIDKFTLWYNKIIANNNIQNKINQLKDLSIAGNEICNVIKKDIITYQALETSKLPSFSYCPEDQMDELKKLVVLSPNQFKALRSNQKHILLRGSYGSGKSLVLFKKFELIVNNMTDSEIVYFICNDQQSEFIQYMKILKLKYRTKNIIICGSDHLTGRTKIIPKLSFILNHIKHVWKDKTVHILIDEFSGSYLNNSEIEKLKNTLHNFQSSYIIIALQSMEQNIVEIKNKEIFSDFGYQFSKLTEETSFTCFSLDYSLRNSREINEFVKATAQILESSKVFLAEKQNFSSENDSIIDNEIGMEYYGKSYKEAAIVTSYKYNQNDSVGHGVKSGSVNVYHCRSKYCEEIIVYLSTLEYILKDLSDMNKYVICTYGKYLYDAVYGFLENSLHNWTNNINDFMQPRSIFTVLLTDYAAVRGYEFNNFIFLAPIGNRFLKYRMLECFTRCTTRLNIISDEKNVANDSIDRQLIMKWKELDCVHFVNCSYYKSADRFFLLHNDTAIYSKNNARDIYIKPKNISYPWFNASKVQDEYVSNVKDDIWMGLKCVVSMDNIRLFNDFINLHNIDIYTYRGIDDQNLLHIASEFDAVLISKILINDYKIDVNSTDKHKNAPLHYAAHHGSSNFADIIIKIGADVNVKDKKGRTPLHKSLYKGHLNIAQLLLDNGADVNVKNKDDDTPLHESSRKGYINIVQLLLNKGADVNASNKDRNTPLNESSPKGYLNIVQLLLDNGAIVNVMNKDGNTPLHKSSYGGYLNIVQLLLNNEADIYVENNFGQTAIDFAKDFYYNDIIELLKRYK